MSSSDPTALHTLAKWRREGYGIWSVTCIVEGYDDEYHYLYPGKLSLRVLKKYATMMCAKELDVKPRYVHVQKMEKQT